MVKQEWMEQRIISIEKERNLNKWTKQKETTFQYLLNLYHTGRFREISKKQILQRINSP